ncbi:MAG: dipeptide ABC transporter ATP-binding protein [Syntrophales bacterium]
MTDVLLDIRGLKKYFTLSGGFLSGQHGVVKAVDGINLQIYRGETLGLVGESGCGKSTLGRLIMRLEEASRGDIFFRGENILTYSGKALKNFRRRVQIVFQDPYASLNPRRTAESIIGEPLVIHEPLARKEQREKIAQLMEVVGLNRGQMKRYPHEFSGGQRQRICVARAIALKPELIVADEPVSALDVSIQAQILNLLKDLQKDFGLTYLFISHDLSVVRHMSNRIAVMYLGKIVELAENKELYENHLHPYTKILLAAVPIPDPSRKRERKILNGDIPTPLDPPQGCAFHPRCPYRMDICSNVEPVLENRNGGHLVACHLEKIPGVEN